MPRLSQTTPGRIALITAVIIGCAGSVQAQSVGVAGGRPIGVYGSYWPAYLGAYPGAYNGFWSNGFSLYGPPVPTYGSVPGVFGGSDQRLYNFSNINIQNGAEIGLGTPGAGGGGPRRRFYYAGENAAPAAATGQATIEVRVPAADAEVFFEGINTRHTGVRRLFLSPVVQVGTTYYYKIRAKWKQPDGTIADQERSVGVRANETVVVDFNAPVKIDDKAPLLGIP
jgi:uncharacterized protein (TIGR03000 family)